MTTALTGAGLSTSSGIPDFRSPQSGMWTRGEPREVASFREFQKRPEVFFAWFRPLARLILDAAPNAAHHALADLERSGYLSSVTTQNIDLLHTRAGSRVVYEVHGHIREATCMLCRRKFPGTPIMEELAAEGGVPYCSKCGGVLKPGVVLFEEVVPPAVLLASQRAACNCDLMLVAGTSLEVYPVADLPALTVRNGGLLIIVNFEPTYLDKSAEVLIHGDVEEVLPAIAAEVLSTPGQRRSA